MEVIKRMGGYNKDITDVCTENFVDFMKSDLLGHYWIVYKEKHYDSECPKGVKNWKNLPIFKRNK